MSADLGPASPFFIVRDIRESLAHYVDRLGFELRYLAPEHDPFFAIVARGSAQLLLKSVGVSPLPNRERHRDALWDAFIFTPDPDTLAAEFGVEASDRKNDGLRGFELPDPDGYIAYFGRPD